MGYTQEITRPYLLVKGDVSAGNYKIIQYAIEEEARKKQIKDKGLAKILKAVPIEQMGIEDAKKISGYAVHRAIDKNHSLFTILSEEDVFFGSSLKTSLVNAVEKKEKYTTNPKYDKDSVYKKFRDDQINLVYGMFRNDQIIISALVYVK